MYYINMNINSEEFKDKVKADLKIIDIATDNLENIAKQHYYYQLYHNSRRVLLKLEEMLDKKYKELYHYYKFEYNHELRANEIELYVKAHKDFKKIRKVFLEKELEIEYLMEIVKMFQSRGWTIKNAIELAKLQS